MSAFKSTIMRVAVTNGDALPENRKRGKSNTGTYFLCSKDQYNDLQLFVNRRTYQVDINKIKEYNILFKKFFFESMDQYPGKMEDFDDFCSLLVNSYNIPSVEISIRENDQRVFLRFVSNENIYVNAIRHILYGEISYLCFEIRGNKTYIYPEIDYSKTNISYLINNDNTIYL